MRSPGWIGAFGVLVVYTLTMSRDLALFDSPELALVAVELGLGHPPGQPLHTLLGALFAHLPGVSALTGLNFMSALCGALTVVPAVSIAQRMLAGPSSTRASWVTVGVIVLAALHPVLWEPATRIEVYSLATLLSVWSLERIQAALMPSEEPPRVHPLITGALLAGLAASVNPVVALSCVLAASPMLLSACVQRRIAWRVLMLAIAAGVIGLLPYAYVIAVAGRTDAFVWGAPTSGTALFDFLRGHDYRHNAGIDAATWIAHVGAWLSAAPARFGALWLVLGVAAHAATNEQRGLGRVTVALLLLSGVGLVCANSVFRIDNPDYHGYLAAPFWLCGAGVAARLVQLVEGRGSRVVPALIVVVLVLSASPAALPLWQRSRAHDHLSRERVERALREAPSHAVVIVESDHWIAPAWYLQRVEGLRSDVVVIGAGLTGSSWYWDLVYRQHPSLAPFALRGPGGRDARLQRFVTAQGRPLLLEHGLLASRLGVAACVAGDLLHASPCGHDLERAHRDADRVAQQLAQLDRSVPLARELLAAWSLQRGEDLWRIGAPNAALHTLLAGVPTSLRARDDIDWKALAKTPALRRPPLTWQREVVLGEPARNLYVAAELLFVAGQRAASHRLAQHAARQGLPEAVTANAP